MVGVGVYLAALTQPVSAVCQKLRDGELLPYPTLSHLSVSVALLQQHQILGAGCMWEVFSNV